MLSVAKPPKVGGMPMTGSFIGDNTLISFPHCNPSIQTPETVVSTDVYLGQACYKRSKFILTKGKSTPGV